MSAVAPPPAAPPASAPPAPPPASSWPPPPGPAGARPALARLLVRLAAVLGLALLGALGWVGMLASDPTGRAWAWVGAGAVGAGALVLARGLPSRVRPAAGVAVAAGLAATALPLAGIPLELLRPRRWDELAGGVGRGLEALPELAIPHAGPVAGWPARALLLLGVLLVVLAVLAAAWPRRDGRTGVPLGAAVPLGILVGAPAVVLPGARPVAQGLVLFLGLVALLAAERVARRDAPVAAAALAAAALVAVVLQPALDADEPWFDYEAAAGRLAASPVRFSWSHRYGPLNWSREGREMFRARSPRASYWKAQDLEGFDGLRWRAFPVRGRSGGAFSDLLQLTARNPGDVRDYEVAIRGVRTQEIVSPGQALGVSRAPRDVDPGASVGTFVSERPLREGDSYRVRAYVPDARPAELRVAGTAYGEELFLDRTIGLPAAPLGEPGPAGALVRREVARGAAPQLLVPPWGSGLPPQVFGMGSAGSAAAAIEGSAYAGVWALAQRLRAASPTPYAYARRIEGHLSRGFRYTESPPSARVPLADFLLETRQGYCQHFSGAMALLLRMGGVPARVAAGFAPGRRDGDTDEWVVRDLDAHSWVEAYFPGTGWVTFDPTPAASPARGQETTNRVPELLAGLIGGRQATGRNLGQGRGGAGTPAGGAAAGADPGGGVPWALVLLAVGAAGAAGALVVARRRRAVGGGDAAVLELERALRRAGRPLRSGTTLSQLEERFRSSPEAAGYVRALRARRFGDGSGPPTPAQRRGLRRELARSLGPLGRLRAWWAVPPACRREGRA